MMLVQCYLGRSAIEGLGVFAGEPIRKGQPVWRLDPTFDILVAKAELEAAPASVRGVFDRYAFEIATHPGKIALDGDDGRFMNHSDTPNLDFSVPGVARAVRDIAAGEELTCSYHQLAAEPFEMQPSRHCV